MEINERIGLAIYLYYNRDARKLTRFGDVLYHSRRLKYVILYIDKRRQKEVMSGLNEMKVVKKVLPSAVSAIDRNFVGNLGNHDA